MGGGAGGTGERGEVVGGGGDKLKDHGKDQYHKPYAFSPTDMPQSTQFNLFNKSTMEPDENIVHSTSYFMHTKFYMLLYLYMILIFTLITLIKNDFTSISPIFAEYH